MELVGKAADAALMFWQSLDSRERAALGYFAAWVALAVLAAARRRDRENMMRDLRTELAGGDAARS